MDIPESVNKSNELNMKEIQVMIAPDSMSAEVCLKVPNPDEPPYTYEEVKEALSSAGVKMGIDESRVHNIVESGIYNKVVIIAKGKMAEDGVDGYYNFHFETDFNKQPEIRADGSADYYHIKLFETVKKGDILAEYFPPTKGVFGYNIKGGILIPKQGKPKSPLRGKGFVVSEDGNTYYADISGKVEYRNYDLRIATVLEINGNADMTSGNIEFDGDVTINGNVISGVQIHAMGNISIKGYVEGANIKAGKDIVFMNGVNGGGIGRIEAKGSISAKYFENAIVSAKGDITAGYILNSNVTADKKVIVQGSKGVICGGEVSGVMGVDVQTIGNEIYTPTRIRVGANKKLRMEYANLIMKIKEISTQIEIFDKAIDRYNALKAINSDKMDAALFKKAFQAKIVKKAEKDKYEAEYNRLYELIREAGKAVVRVNGKIFYGTKIYMDDMIYVPDDVFSHVIIRKFNDNVVLRGYDE